MSTTQQPDALDLADWLDAVGNGGISSTAAAAELRRLHAENESLRTGYAAARLEIESLQRRVQEVGAAARREHERADRAMRAAQPAEKVIIDFPQVGSAGPFPVVNGRVSLPGVAMQDLVHMLRPTYEAQTQQPGAAYADLPQGWPARFRCDSCDGNGEIGEPMYQGHFQPPERASCSDCGGKGWCSEESAFSADDMRSFADATHALRASHGQAPAQAAPAAVAGQSEMHEAMCPALTGGRCTCERNDPAVDKAWARFCGGIGDGPDAPYPGMISAFERYYSQSFTDKDWRNEASVWAAAWKQAMLTAAAPTTQPAPHPVDEFQPCPSCFGKGVEGDADDYGHTIDVTCGECNGSGRAKATAQPAPQQEAQEPVDADEAALGRWLLSLVRNIYRPGYSKSELYIDGQTLAWHTNAAEDIRFKQDLLREMPEKFKAAPRPAQRQATAQVEPMFWVRLRSDGGYEGPIHNDGIERVRRLSGAWSPLYLHPAPQGDSLDAVRLDWLRENSCDLRCIDSATGQGDGDVHWVVIEHHMAAPVEREIGRAYRDDPRAAIDAARAQKGGA